MLKNILSQKGSIVVVGVLLVVLGGGYYFFMASTSEAATSDAPMDPSLLDSKFQKFLKTQSKVNLKDDSFRTGKNKVLYESLHDYSETIPLIDPPGRANPFVPYTATP